MATHSSILAWKIPWTEEPGGLQSKQSEATEHHGLKEMDTYSCPVLLNVRSGVPTGR